MPQQVNALLLALSAPKHGLVGLLVMMVVLWILGCCGVEMVAVAATRIGGAMGRCLFDVVALYECTCCCWYRLECINAISVKWLSP